MAFGTGWEGTMGREDQQVNATGREDLELDNWTMLADGVRSQHVVLNVNGKQVLAASARSLGPNHCY